MASPPHKQKSGPTVSQKPTDIGKLKGTEESRADAQKVRAPPPPPVPRELSAKKAEDGLVELADVDIQIVRNPEEPKEGEDGKRPSSQPPRELTPITYFGRFGILGRIAFGGMAEIFLAREEAQAGASRLLVVKRILPHVADDENFTKMFLDEARLAMQLSHPNICHIYEFGQLEGAYFIAMEWINGVQLGKLIRRARSEGGLPPQVAVRVISRIAEALHYAHRAKDQLGRPLGIVHRDVSPHNIMVSYDGNVKLLDFGIAKAASHNTKTQAGVIKGKFSYMSPQQCLGQSIDGRADVFALGVVLWESLTGKPLYHRKTEYETMRAVIEEAAPPLQSVREGLPPRLNEIVQKALAKSENDRYPTAGALQEDLERWLSEEHHVVNAAKIGEYMEQLYEDEIKRGPLVDSTPFGMSLNQRPGTPISGSGAMYGMGSRSGASGEVMPPKRSATVPILSAIIVLLLAAGGAYAFMQSREEPEAPEQPVAAAEPQTQPAPNHAAGPAEPTEPAEEESAEPAVGALVIRSRPTGATIRIDDRELTETTPTILTEIPAGSHQISISANGYETWREEIDVVADDRTNVNAVLERVRRPTGPATPPGRLSINTRPWSKVYVGGRQLGTTPIGGATVPSGTLRLRLVDRDGNTHYRSVQVPAGDEARAFFDLSE